MTSVTESSSFVQVYKNQPGVSSVENTSKIRGWGGGWWVVNQLGYLGDTFIHVRFKHSKIFCIDFIKVKDK
ncbi:hypothetical protein KUTeg_005225 [Tegillarca granosa]|uniref:Uncharacterized protein n=1 Tax=Tegillarca granosa TaxID=220873 RepID=A0ABQ9FMB3_TEGGR|nr:hypothetical protein KUTeg_005225 [Tegillarca granosa]